jgi:hypothetical protein
MMMKKKLMKKETMIMMKDFSVTKMMVGLFPMMTESMMTVNNKYIEASLSLVVTSLQSSMDITRLRKTVANKIADLSATEHDEILKIIRRYDVPCTYNKNGAFVNLSLVSDEAVQDILKFIDFCAVNKQELDEYEKKITECKLHNDYKSVNRDEDVVSSVHSDGTMRCTSSNACTAHGSESTIKSITDELDGNEVEKEKLQRFIDTAAKMQHIDAKSMRKTITNNKFIAAKKRYGRKPVKSENDLPDALQPSSVIGMVEQT